MKFWTHPDYHDRQLRKDFYAIDDIALEVVCGRFKIKYTGYDNKEYFGVFSWKGCSAKIPHVEFYEDDILLFTKAISRPREFHFIIGGDGETRENTFYLWFGKNEKGYQSGKINDFNDEHIKDVQLGPDCYVGTISVSEHYFVALTEEMCTNSRFFGLIDKRKFFIRENPPCWNGLLNIPAQNLDPGLITLEGQLAKAQELTQSLNLPKPYNDARLGLCVDFHNQCGECMEPIEAVKDGLIFADVKYQDNYKVKMYSVAELVLYDEVINYDQQKFEN